MHFLSFPEVRQEYFDPVIVRRFTALQAVIELCRTVRERNRLPLKVSSEVACDIARTIGVLTGDECCAFSQIPLKELVVFHAEQEFLEDVRSLSTYIEEELNIRDLTLSSDEKACGVRFRVTADWPVLGRKLRKDLGKVKAGLEHLTSEDVKNYIATGKVNVAGIELVEGDLRVIRYVDTEGLQGQYDHNTDGNVVILLDTVVRPELQAEGTAREVINRIQRLRKKAALQATDEIDAFYSFEAGLGAALTEVIESQGDIFARVLKRKPLPVSARAADAVVIMEEEQEVGDDKFVLSLVRAA